MSGVSRRVLMGVGLLGVITLLVTSGIAQVQDDPRNASDEYFDAVNGANCYAHHGGEGFRAMAFTLNTRYSELPIGETVELELQIRHNSDITQDMLDIAVTVDTSQAPNVQVITEDFVEDTQRTFQQELNAGSLETAVVDVLSGAVGLNASVTSSASGPESQGGEIDFRVVAPDGSAVDGTGDAFSKSVSMDQSALEGAGPGAYTLEMMYEHPLPQVAGAIEAEVQLEVNYAQTQTSFRFEPVARDGFATGPIRGSDPGNLKSRLIVIPIVITSEEEALLDFRAEAINFWEHQAGDGAIRDDGLYYRFTTMQVKGGTDAVRVESAVAPVPTGPTVDLYNMFTRILGYIAIVLVPIAMITGGMFGKGSRRWLNKVTGGAKKRVMWHNAMSFMIIGVATIHFFLALVESKYKWTAGLFWGGVGWAVLVSLGFTGWYQVRMIKRWNYKVWRHTHLWTAVTVFSFSLVHLVLEGSDFAFLREMLPAWHSKLIWP